VVSDTSSRSGSSPARLVPSPVPSTRRSWPPTPLASG
jgi:hypothetical protein